MKKSLCMLLALLLTLSLFGCQTNPPVETTEPEPQAAAVYQEARAELDSLDAVTLDVVQTLSTQVEYETIEEKSEFTVSFAGLNTPAPMAKLEETVNCGIDEEGEEEIRLYTEIYADGKLYAQLEDSASVTGAISGFEKRYVPAVLLNAENYGVVTMEQTEEQTVVSFSDATAAESWAIPEEAQLVEASGSAVIDAEGKLQSTQYTVSYRYGSVQITRSVTATPRAEAEPVEVPENTKKYVELSCVDVLRTSIRSEYITQNMKTVSLSSQDEIVSQAAGVSHSTSSEMHIHGMDELMFCTDITAQVYDAQNGVQNVNQKESYIDGKYVITVNDGVPTSQVGMDEELFDTYCKMELESLVTNPEFWEKVTLTELPGILFYEFVYSDDFGDSCQNLICTMFWQDPGFLNKYASGYENKELTGYLAIDRYTGIITAAGLYYEGAHTIEGEECILSMSSDQAVVAPAFGAYKEITGEAAEEETTDEQPTPLFYHVTGEEGQELWLLGTIHVGDERTGNLPQEIYDAFTASDALALESDTEKFEQQVQEDEALQEKVAESYYYTDGSTTDEHLDSELYELALKYVKASGGNNSVATYMKASVWQNLIDNFYLQLGHTLRPEQGVEERLTAWAKEQEKPIREVESSIFQIQLLNSWPEEMQEIMLEMTMQYDIEEYWAEITELYELWCAGDEQGVRDMLAEEADPAEMTEEELELYNAYLPYKDQYDKAIEHDRNEGMLDVAIEYLESGDVVFYAVGLAHLLGDDNGLVDALQQAGYTVELVSYQ